MGAFNNRQKPSERQASSHGQQPSSQRDETKDSDTTHSQVSIDIKQIYRWAQGHANDVREVRMKHIVELAKLSRGDFQSITYGGQQSYKESRRLESMLAHNFLRVDLQRRDFFKKMEHDHEGDQIGMSIFLVMSSLRSKIAESVSPEEWQSIKSRMPHIPDGLQAMMEPALCHDELPLHINLKSKKDTTRDRSAHEMAYKKLRQMWSEDLRVVVDWGALVDWGQQAISSRWARMFMRRMQAHYTNERRQIIKYIQNLEFFKVYQALKC